MASLTAIASNAAGTAIIGPLFPDSNGTEIHSRIAAAAIAVGQCVYVNSSGTADLCNTNSAGKQQARGIALETVGAGQAVDVLSRGMIGGFDLSGLAFDAIVYASDTAGAIDGTAGTKTVPIGRVVPLTSRDSAGAIQKALMVSPTYLTNY